MHLDILNIETNGYKNMKDMDDDEYWKGRSHKEQIRIVRVFCDHKPQKIP